MDINNWIEMEASLIDRSLSGDRNAFGELVEWHYPRVVQIVYRLCGEKRLAEDMTQEAFLKAWIKLASYQRNASFRNWLYRIAINTTLDELRRKKELSIEDEKIQMQPDPSPGPEQALINLEQSVLVQEALSNLPEEARGVLVLREYGGLSYREIASVLDIPVGTVMSRLNSARNQLRKNIIAYTVLMEYDHA